ncbi:MAG: 2-C-methyl-D-erythritol 4-phosphate cytidylyltransferase [Trueperaceae bacterium]
MSVAALIPAAGAGVRAGLGPKAFVRVAGRSLVAHAADLFDGLVDERIVAVPAGREAEAQTLVPQVRIVPGGATRQATVAAMLRQTTAEWVLIHDAARPLAPRDLVERVLRATREHGAASAALPVSDTLHDAARDVAVPRDALRLIQTPQGFRRETLAAAHDAAARDGVDATDDATLLRWAGGRVALVEGSPWAVKLTTRADLAWIEALASSRAACRASSRAS